MPAGIEQHVHVAVRITGQQKRKTCDIARHYAAGSQLIDVTQTQRQPAKQVCSPRPGNAAGTYIQTKAAGFPRCPNRSFAVRPNRTAAARTAYARASGKPSHPQTFWNPSKLGVTPFSVPARRALRTSLGASRISGSCPSPSSGMHRRSARSAAPCSERYVRGNNRGSLPHPPSRPGRSWIQAHSSSPYLSSGTPNTWTSCTAG